MSLADFKALKPSTKYHNEYCHEDGWLFHSKLERDRYVELKRLQAAGAVLWFLCQVPFRLPGHSTYRADFLVVWPGWKGDGWQDERVIVEDCKGRMTPLSQLKIKQVEEIYGIKVKIITRKDVR